MRLFRARGFPAGCSGLQRVPARLCLFQVTEVRRLGAPRYGIPSPPLPMPLAVVRVPRKGHAPPPVLGRYRYLREPVPAQYHVPSIAVNPRLSCLLLGPLPKSPPSPITTALALAVADFLSSPFPRPIPLLAIPSPALIPSVLHLHLRLPLPSFSLAACAGDWLCSLSLGVCLTQFLSHLSPPHHHPRLLLVSLPCPSMLITPAASLARGTWARLFSFVFD